jgi:hypothetical protein
MQKERVRKCMISFLIILQFVALFSLTAPKTSGYLPWTTPIHDFVRPVAQTLGLWQSWDMFSPNPRDDDVRFYARAVLKDHSLKEWSPPDPLIFGFFKRHSNERFRKWTNDHLRLNRDRRAWRDAVHFMVSQMGETIDSVQKIQFVREWRRVKPFGLRFDEDREWHSFAFYKINLHPPSAVKIPYVILRSSTHETPYPLEGPRL